MALSKQFNLYESEITQFINGMKEKNPKLEEEQRAGRALLWDKTPVSLDNAERDQTSRVKQQPYVYQNK